MTPDAVLAQLDQYSFHDLVIESIQLLSTEAIGLAITAKPYSDELEVYTTLQLKFSSVSALQMDALSLAKDSELEMYRFDYRYNTCFECEMLFLTGWGNPDFRLNFSCESIELEEAPMPPL